MWIYGTLQEGVGNQKNRSKEAKTEFLCKIALAATPITWQPAPKAMSFSIDLEATFSTN